MSGIAGYAFVEGFDDAKRTLRQTGSHFCGPNYRINIYSENDFGIVVSSRFKESGPARSFGEILENDRFVLACEGYIVNLNDIAGESGRAAFQSRGHILIELYVKYGRGLFPKLNGAYNIVVWDKGQKTCTINTCKLGQRVLYTNKVRGGLIFGSEAKVFPYISNLPLSLDYETLWMTFMYGGVYGSRTLFKGVTKLFPGTSLVITKDSTQKFKATDIQHEVQQNTSKKKKVYLERLDELMSKSMSRLIAVTKSQAVMVGGVDSSLVAAYLKRVKGEATAVTQAMPGEWNESDDAARITGSLGCDHYTFPYTLDGDKLIKDIGGFVEVTEEAAYWNQLGPPLIHLLPFIRKSADSYLTGAEADLLLNFRNQKQTSLRGFIQNGVFWMAVSHSIRKRLRRILPKPEHIGETESDTNTLDRALMKKLISIDCSGAENNAYPFQGYYTHLPPGKNLQRHFLNHGWQNIRIISQIAQYSGAEALFPYLDDDTASFLLSIPDELKVNKALLRVLLKKYLPGDLVPRKKRGYWSNTIRWHYDAGLLDHALDLLSSRRALNRDIYNKSELSKLIEGYRSKDVTPVWHPVLWQLLLFEIFCRRFIDIGTADKSPARSTENAQKELV